MAKFLNEEKAPDAVKMYLREINKFPLFSTKKEKEAGERLVLARQKLFSALLSFSIPQNQEFEQALCFLKNKNSIVLKKNRKAYLSKQNDIFEYIVVFQSSYGMWPKISDLQTRFKEFFENDEDKIEGTVNKVELISYLRIGSLLDEVKLRQYLTKKIKLAGRKKLNSKSVRKQFFQLHPRIFSKILFQAQKPKLWKYWEEKIWEELLQIPRLPDDLKTTKVNLLNVENEFMGANLRLVVANAKKYWHKCDGSKIEFSDLVQEGNFGLQRAIRRFDPKMGYKFSTFSTSWIKQSIQRAFDNYSSTIVVPVHVMEKFRKINRVSAKLIKELNRAPSLEEIAADLPKRMKLAAGDVKNILEQCRGVVYLDKKIEGLDDDGDSILDFIKDGCSLPDKATEAIKLEEAVDEVFNDVLTEREAEIINCRFGRHGQKECTLAQLGEIFHLSRERIRQIEEKAIECLRRWMNNPRFLELHR